MNCFTIILDLKAKIVITSHLSWEQHITKKASKNLWMLINLKRLGASPDKLLTIYLLKIRSLLEYATPVLNTSLTVDPSNQLETTQ